MSARIRSLLSAGDRATALDRVAKRIKSGCVWTDVLEDLRELELHGLYAEALDLIALLRARQLGGGSRSVSAWIDFRIVVLRLKLVGLPAALPDVLAFLEGDRLPRAAVLRLNQVLRGFQQSEPPQARLGDDSLDSRLAREALWTSIDSRDVLASVPLQRPRLLPFEGCVPAPLKSVHRPDNDGESPLDFLDLGESRVLWSGHGARVESRVVPSWLSVRIDPRTPSYDLPGSWLLIADRFDRPNYCHWLLDWATRAVIADDLGLPFHGILVRKMSAGFQSQVLDGLGLGGLRTCSLEEGVAYKVERLIVPTNIRPRNINHPAFGVAPIAVKRWRRKPSDRGASRAASRRIYIRRRRGRAVANEREVLDVLRNWGYAAVFMEDLSFEEQRHVALSAESIVSVHGAGLANIAFAEPGTHVLEFFGETGNSAAYCLLAAGLDQRYAFSWTPPRGARDGVYFHPFNDSPARVDLARLEAWAFEAHGAPK